MYGRKNSRGKNKVNPKEETNRKNQIANILSLISGAWAMNRGNDKEHEHDSDELIYKISSKEFKENEKIAEYSHPNNE